MAGTAAHALMGIRSSNLKSSEMLSGDIREYEAEMVQGSCH